MKNIDINERLKHYNVTGLGMALISNNKISKTSCFGFLEAGSEELICENSIFSACSISKFLTSILVLKLNEEGVLDLDEDVNKKITSWKIPSNKFTQNKKVTLRSLLSHQSGIVDPQGSFGELKFNDDIPTITELLEGRTSYCNESIEVKYIPDSHFQYSDAGFCIIQQLIEDVTGKTFNVLIDEFIFKPLNMKNSTFEHVEKVRQLSSGHNKDGNVVDGNYPIYPYPAAAGLWTTPSDLAILVIELMNSLKGESKIGLSKSKIKEMISSQGCNEWVGLGIFLDNSGEKIEISSLGWGVGFQSMMISYPYQETGAVIMTNTDLGVHQLKGIIGDVYKSLIL
jgi:CubicO group peptidase (beta-lactamase class C family)